MLKFFLIILLCFFVAGKTNGQRVSNSTKKFEKDQPTPKPEEIYTPVPASGKPRIYIQDSTTYRVGVNYLKSLPQIKVTQGYKVDSTVAYFTGTGFSNIHVTQIAGDSLSQINQLISRCSIGSSITFDNVRVKKGKGKSITIEGLTVIITSDSAVNTVIQTAPELTRLRELTGKYYISGTIYFSGKGFNNVITISANSLQTSGRVFLFNCVPGSIISFSNCVYMEKETKKYVTITETVSIK